MRVLRINLTILIITLMLITMIGLGYVIDASTFSISVLTNLDIGNTTTLTINAGGLTGPFNVSSSDSSIVSVSSSIVFIDNGISDRTITLTAKKAGNVTLTVAPGEISDASSGDIVSSLSPKQISITVPTQENTTGGGTTTPIKSSNNYLSSLTTNPSGFSPKFSKTTTSYSMTVGKDVTKVDVTAPAEDSKSKVNITGNTNLKAGNNTCKIVVTAENGSTKTYTLTIKKEGEPEDNVIPEAPIEETLLRLQKIEITNPRINLNFDPEVFEYNVTLTEDLEKLDIAATSNIEGAIVEILGNEDLQIGENIITILLSIPSSEEVVTYQVIVNKVIAAQEETPVVEKDRLSPNNRVGSRLIAIAVIWLIAGIAFITIEYFYTKKHVKSSNIASDVDFKPVLNEENSKKNKKSKH